MLEQKIASEVGKKVMNKLFCLESSYNQSLINELRLKMILEKYQQDIPRIKIKHILNGY